MNKKNVTIRSLIVSIVFMFLCSSMFIGTTFAWLTDSVTSANNKIESGTLDVDFLKYNEDRKVYESIASKDGAIFTQENGTNWEPGKTEVVYFQVKNKGNLYLKYDFLISVLDQGLIGSLDYAIIKGDYNTVSVLDSWEKIVDKVGNANAKALTEGKHRMFAGQLAPSDDANHGDAQYFALAIHMREGVSNEFQGKRVSIDASIFATQASAESDSFNEGYDANATYSYVTYDGTKDFQTFWNETPEGSTIYLDKNIDLSSLTVDKSMTIDATGKGIAIAESLVLSEGKALTIKNAKMKTLSVTGKGTLGLTSVTIGATQDGVATARATGTKVHALTLDNADLKLEVKGYTVFTGATGGSGIYVGKGSLLDLSGTGKLIAVGNAGTESIADKIGGSGIGGEGAINIHDMANLTAEGYGLHAFGIGGNGVDVTIKASYIENVRGGYASSTMISDPDYGKSEPEGGAAIGGANIILDSVIIKNAEGGSKAAGIGAQFHQAVTINISNSTIENVVGGNGSAGIGGSRIHSGDARDQKVEITIKDSTITAQGGQYGAGIGSGYDTYCHTPDIAAPCIINIRGKSVINATGGERAAGIGTGYHAGGLDGEIEETVKVTAKGDSYVKDGYTMAQDIGFGVIDPTRDGKNNSNSINYKGTEITLPIAK